jgi:serine/threonine protein kinase
LDEAPVEHRGEALQDLAGLHLELTWKAGEGLLLEQYFAELSGEFAEFSSPAAVPASLIEDEFLARYHSPGGDFPAIDEYRRRFPMRPEAIQLLRSRMLGNGRYVKLRVHGRGAASVVWRAYDRRLNRTVAIKTLQPMLSVDHAAAARFLDDICMLAGLKHPGIVAVDEWRAGREGGPWCVMPWIEGTSLAEQIRNLHAGGEDRSARQRRQLERQLLEAFTTVCDAVAFAHFHGVLHRDLKPGNILLGDLGRAVVLDWQRDVIGTPEYMPPEQIDGRADARSDVFGLGAVLYEILTGQPPHPWSEHRRPPDWPELVRQACIPCPRRLRGDVSRSLEAVAMKALARDPADRYSSAAEIAQEIRQYVAGGQVQAQRESPLARLWRWLGEDLLSTLP